MDFFDLLYNCDKLPLVAVLICAVASAFMVVTTLVDTIRGTANMDEVCCCTTMLVFTYFVVMTCISVATF